MGLTNLLVSFLIAVALAVVRIAALIACCALRGAARAVVALLRLASRPALRLVAGREARCADEEVP